MHPAIKWLWLLVFVCCAVIVFTETKSWLFLAGFLGGFISAFCGGNALEKSIIERREVKNDH